MAEEPRKKQILMVDGIRKMEINALHVDSDPNVPQIAEIDGKFYYLDGKPVTSKEHLEITQPARINREEMQVPGGLPCPSCGKKYPDKKSLSGHKLSHRKEATKKEPVAAS